MPRDEDDYPAIDWSYWAWYADLRRPQPTEPCCCAEMLVRNARWSRQTGEDVRVGWQCPEHGIMNVQRDAETGKLVPYRRHAGAVAVTKPRKSLAERKREIQQTLFAKMEQTNDA